MNDNEEICKWCKYWTPLLGGNLGVCYCMPPTPSSLNRDGIQPRTGGDDWCGQWVQCSDEEIKDRKAGR